MAKQMEMRAAVWPAHQVLIVIAWEHEKDGKVWIPSQYR